MRLELIRRAGQTCPGTTSHVFPTVQVNKNGYVYNNWLGRRKDLSNILTHAWANVSKE